MLGRLLILGFFIALSILVWFGNLYYPHPYLEKIFSTFVALAGIYLIFKVLFEELVSARIKDSKARYSFRKVVSILYIAVFLVAMVAIWIERPEALLVTYGIIAAGVAVALQDLFKRVTEKPMLDSSVRTVLVISISGLGNTLLFTPALRALRKRHRSIEQ